MATDKIKVAVRVRPFNRRELELQTDSVVEMESQQTILHNPSSLDKMDRKPPLPLPDSLPPISKKKKKRESIWKKIPAVIKSSTSSKQPKTFAFDHCFYSTDTNAKNYASQETVFNSIGRDILENAFEGYNACIFAYGQTDLDVEEKIDFKYELTIGEKTFNMNVIFISRTSDEKVFLMNNLLVTSQFSFPWEENATLFRDVTSFHILNNFIVHNKWEEHVLQITDGKKLQTPTKNVASLEIKVVKFDNRLNKFDVINKYRKWILDKTNYKPSFYFVTKAFPWIQQQPFVPDFESLMIYNAMPIVISTSLKNMDIFSLMALKLALFDLRYPDPGTIMNNEIDVLVQKAVKVMVNERTFIQNEVFNIEQYVTAKNVQTTSMVVLCFRYEYQNFFKSVKGQLIEQLSKTRKFLNPNLSLTRTVHLKNQNNFIEIIQKNPRQIFFINGMGFDQMTSQLLISLLALHNVEEITLDTNYQWTDRHLIIDRVPSRNKLTRVNLVGTDQFYFIEEFLLSVSNIPSINTMLNLHVYDKIYSCLRFKNLLLLGFLTFHNVQITNDMLKQLKASNLKTRVEFLNCTIDANIINWDFLNDLNEVQVIEIREDELTWAGIFNFIIHFCENSSILMYRFKNFVKILHGNNETIDLEKLIFYIENTESKLEIRDDNGRQIDLFYLKNKIEIDDRSSFDFYN